VEALAVLGLIQFILVLDMTVVNVALPRILALPRVQDDLGSRAGLAWVVNGCVLMAGGFVLLGGRLADLLGRRRMFLAGVALFAVASAASARRPHRGCWSRRGSPTSRRGAGSSS